MRGVALVLVLALALGLAAREAAAGRLFDSQKQPLKRPVGKRKMGKDGKPGYKEVDSEAVGRAAFDPQYGLDEGMEADDIGYAEAEVHAATPGVVEARLKELFPRIDLNRDGAISVEELQHHLYTNGVGIAHRRADAEFDDYDTDKDGKLTAAEYLKDLEGDSEAVKAAVAAFTTPSPLDYGAYTPATLAAMVLADADGDRALAREEFFDFLNPEEGTNTGLKLHRLRGDIHDHLEALHHERAAAAGAPPSDARYSAPTLALTFDDFLRSFWPQFTVWEGGAGGDAGWDEEKERVAAMRRFVLLDTDADNSLTAEELLPVFNDVHPSESRYARMQAEHMFEMAEVKGDRLTLEQMLQTPHAFYGAVHDEHHEEL